MSSISKCPITLKEITQPVFCKVTKLVYEKQAILDQIHNKGKCPLTGKEISETDLIDIVQREHMFYTNNNTSSFYDFLERIKSEYNSLLYEKVKLSKQYETIQIELADKIAKNAGSLSVIARLLKEKEEVVSELNAFKQQNGIEN